jgi:hypothetical protein
MLCAITSSGMSGYVLRNPDEMPREHRRAVGDRLVARVAEPPDLEAFGFQKSGHRGPLVAVRNRGRGREEPVGFVGSTRWGSRMPNVRFWAAVASGANGCGECAGRELRAVDRTRELIRVERARPRAPVPIST